MVPRIQWPSRNTKCMSVRLSGVTLWYSYNTCIAAAGMLGDTWTAIRQPNNWGPTTGRHFSESSVRDYKIINDEKQFMSLVSEMVGEGVAKEMVDRVVSRVANA